MYKGLIASEILYSQKTCAHLQNADAIDDFGFEFWFFKRKQRIGSNVTQGLIALEILVCNDKSCARQKIQCDECFWPQRLVFSTKAYGGEVV